MPTGGRSVTMQTTGWVPDPRFAQPGSPGVPFPATSWTGVGRRPSAGRRTRSGDHFASGSQVGSLPPRTPLRSERPSGSRWSRRNTAIVLSKSDVPGTGVGTAVGAVGQETIGASARSGVPGGGPGRGRAVAATAQRGDRDAERDGQQHHAGDGDQRRPGEEQARPAAPPGARAARRLATRRGSQLRLEGAEEVVHRASPPIWRRPLHSRAKMGAHRASPPIFCRRPASPRDTRLRTTDSDVRAASAISS